MAITINDLLIWAVIGSACVVAIIFWIAITVSLDRIATQMEREQVESKESVNG